MRLEKLCVVAGISCLLAAVPIILLLKLFPHPPTGVSDDRPHRRTVARDAAGTENADHARTRATMMKWRRRAGELTCQIDDVGPNGGWCLKPTGETWGRCRAAEFHVPADAGIARTLVKYLAPPGHPRVNLLDIGAGVGQYGCFFEAENSNIAWRGYDGAENIESFTSEWVKWIDVTDRLYDTIEPPGFVADWVMSLEVGEHIPPSTTDAFLDLLDRHNSKGIILSWAIPGQGGHSHINNLPNSQVIAALAQRGYVQDEWCTQFQEEARKQAKYEWFRNTFMVFLRRRDGR